MNQNLKLDIKAENTAVKYLRYEEKLSPLDIKIPTGDIAGDSVGILDLEKIYPRLLIWWPSIIWEEEKKEKIHLILPERLTRPSYGSSELEQHLKELSKTAPPIEKIWRITKKLPFLSKMILEERRENE